MKKSKLLQNFLNILKKTARKTKYLRIAVITVLLIVSWVNMNLITFANQSSNAQAKLQEFNGVVRIYQKNSSNPKIPKKGDLAKVPDKIWVAGDTQSLAKFQLSTKDSSSKSKQDILITAGPNNKATEYILPCVVRGGSATVGWGISTVNSSACKEVVFERSNQKTKKTSTKNRVDAGNDPVAYNKEIAKDNSNAEKTQPLIITRSQNSSLINFSEDEDDTMVNVLVGSVEIGSFGQVKAGDRYSNLKKTIQKVDPKIMAQLPSVQQFLDPKGWSSDVSSLIDEFNFSLSNSELEQKQEKPPLPTNLLQEFKGHQGSIYSVSFSPDGKNIATASGDKTARLWNLQGEMIQEFKGHEDNVYSVSFSPDSTTLATASADKTVRLWNLQGEMIQEFKGHQEPVYAVSFSPDGKTIVSASYDKTARLWNLQGQLLQEFTGHQGSVIDVSFSADGKTIATASADKTVRLWNLQGKLLEEFKGHEGAVYAVSFSPDGKTIATTSDDKTARLWNLQGQLLQEFTGHQGTVMDVSFSPDGKTLATASDDKTARLWNLEGKLIQEFKDHGNWVNSVSFSPEGKTIATASHDKIARLWKR